MSIIYDALKKVEVAIDKTPTVKVNKERKPRFKTYLIYVSVICVGFFVAYIFFGLFTKPLKTSTTVTVKSPAPPPSSLLPPPAPPSTDIQKPAQPSLTLNGVFFSEDQGYALINNRIVKEGDLIDGVTVVRITLEEVDLNFQGQDIKLSTANK